MKCCNLKSFFTIFFVIIALSGCAQKSPQSNLGSVKSKKEILLNFKDQETNSQDIYAQLGKPNKVIEFAHKSNFEYVINSQTYCIYLDGSGLIWATDNKSCSTKESYLPDHSLTSPDGKIIRE